MKRNTLLYSTLIFLGIYSLIMPGKLFSQEGNYTVNIKQPTQDTIYKCPGENIVFVAEGVNPNGMPFDNNQVTFTWEFGSGGDNGVGATLAHAFEDGGHYLVRLLVTSNTGNQAENIPEVHVFIGMAPHFTGTRSDQSSICSGNEITLTGFVTPNPWTGDEFEFENTYSQSGFTWEGAMISSNRNGIARANPPLDEGHQKYIFRVEDDRGCPHDTTLTLYGLYAEYSFAPDNGEAPLEVDFTPKDVDNGGSLSEVTYLWEAYERRTNQADILSSSVNPFIFERPGEYITWMTARYNQCTYRFDITDKYVRVDSSLLEVPNVFTPNEDGLNDFFQVKSVSIQSFSGRVYNRWGKLVYEWTDWKNQDAGWNGRNQGTGNESPSGTYYYVIEARGWDWDYATDDFKEYKDTKKDKENRIYTGFVTLLR